MIIVDKPYVSDFLIQTLQNHPVEVIDLPNARELLHRNGINFISLKEATEKLTKNPETPLFTISENSIGLIEKHFGFTHFPDRIDAVKNKARFRKLTAVLNPGFFFREINLDEFDLLNPIELPQPFIIKPVTGFFSLGVYKVTNPANWPDIKNKILSEMAIVENTYPPEVLSTKRFIIEQCIDGDEYTTDAYFDAEGKPIILGMMHHVFASAEDMSDRLYLTSRKVISENYGRFYDFFVKAGKLLDLKNFLIHAEVRVNEKGEILPIEINPLRFGGWCTSAELTHYAFGFNPYLAVENQLKPDWEQILKTCSDDIFSIIILNNSTGVDARDIKSFYYDKLLARLHRPLEIRKVDARKFHIYGFIYAQTRQDNFSELEHLLKNDLREFVEL